MLEFGERLRIARKNKHLTQETLAELLGKSANTIGLYERGQREPSLETLVSISDLLEVSADYLLNRSDISNPPQSDSQIHQDLDRRLSRLEELLLLK